MVDQYSDYPGIGTVWTVQVTHVVLNHDTKVGNKSYQTNLRAVRPFLQIKFTNELYLHGFGLVQDNCLYYRTLEAPAQTHTFFSKL